MTALALTPGWLRSERVLEREGLTEENWREGYEMGTATRGRQGWLASESPRYVGRAVVALAGDVQTERRAGEILTSWDLAEEYGFCDVNGTRPRVDGPERRDPQPRRPPPAPRDLTTREAAAARA